MVELQYPHQVIQLQDLDQQLLDLIAHYAWGHPILGVWEVICSEVFPSYTLRPK